MILCMLLILLISQLHQSGTLKLDWKDIVYCQKVHFVPLFYSAAGLYYLAELVEEYTVMTGKIIRYLVMVCVLFVFLWYINFWLSFTRCWKGVCFQSVCWVSCIIMTHMRCWYSLWLRVSLSHSLSLCLSLSFCLSSSVSQTLCV